MSAIKKFFVPGKRGGEKAQAKGGNGTLNKSPTYSQTRSRIDPSELFSCHTSLPSDLPVQSHTPKDLDFRHTYHTHEIVPEAEQAFRQDDPCVLAAYLQLECETGILHLLKACLNSHELLGASATAIKNYVQNRYTSDLPATKQWTVPELKQAAKLHDNISHAALIFCRYCSSNGPIDKSKPETLSTAEIARLHRALYQYELYCRLFSVDRPTSRGKSGGLTQGLSEGGCYDKENIFLTSLEPWEIEELTCIYEFLKDKYRFFMKIIDRHAKEFPMHMDGNFSSDDSDNEYSLEATFHLDYLENYGIEFFIEAARLKGERDKLRQHIGGASRQVHPSPFHHSLSMEPSRLPEFDAAESEKPDHFLEHYAELKFEGDTYVQPNKGWTMAHKDEMSHWYAEEVFRPLRRWGYVFWDQKSFEEGSAASNAIEKYAYSRHKWDYPWEYLGCSAEDSTGERSVSPRQT